ncbi:LOW QUALITY PROTEIN: transposase, partial [Streptomyces viridosporus ATCC 14672]
NEAGVRDQLHQLLLNKLRSKNQRDWSRAVIDSPPGFAGAPPPTSGPHAGAQERTQPGRPRTAGQQTPHHHRRPRDPARGVADRRKPQATSRNCCPSWTRSRQWRELSAGRAGGPTCSSPTAATTTTSTADSCGSAESGPRSPSGASRTAPVRAPSAGWSGERSPGCMASAAYGSAGRDATTSTRRSSASPSV